MSTKFIRRTFMLLALPLLIAAAAQDAGKSTEGDHAAGGIFTEEQAERGGQAYFQSCAECHGIRLNGGMGPALTGEAFMSEWGSETVQEFYVYVKENMPLGLGGTLPDETYVDIVAHILAANDHPAGDTELTADSEAMAEVRVSPDDD